VHVLKSLAFSYDSLEDRILAAVNPGEANAWSCWLTRRLALAMVQQTQQFLDRTSPAAQHTTPEFRSEVIAFERDAAIANTAKAMRRASADVIQPGAATAERADRVTIGGRGAGKFQIELHGVKGGSAAGIVARADLQRLLKMLQDEIDKARWMTVPTAPSATAGRETTAPPLRPRH